MSKIVKELSTIVGTYKNANGETKNRYQRIGSIIATKNGDMGKIDVLPLKEGGWDGWFYINDPRPKEDRQPKSAGFPDDDMDF